MSDEAREDGGMKDADYPVRRCGTVMVERVRRRVWRKASTLNRKKQLRRRQKILDGDEARLIAMVRGTAGGSRLDPEAVG